MRSKEERRQEMFALIEQSQSSGQTNKEFCQEHGISPAVFYYWQKRYRQLQDDQSTGFGEVNLKAADEPSGMYIEYPNGVRLHVSRDINLTTLQRLITLV